MNAKEYSDTLALVELIREDAISFADAVKWFREDHKVSLTYCVNLGVVASLQYAASCAAKAKKDNHAPL